MGDSYVDTGNYPSPTHVQHPTLYHLSLYTPTSNPITDEMTGLTPDFLHKSLSHQKDGTYIHERLKTLHTVTWPLYLVHHLTQGKEPLIPWVRSQESAQPQHINYAWISAFIGDLSQQKENTGSCLTGNGILSLTKNDSKTSILKSRDQYLKETGLNSEYDRLSRYASTCLIIPNLMKQIDLFCTDIVINRTDRFNLFIQIGANDLTHFLFKNYKEAFLSQTEASKSVFQQKFSSFYKDRVTIMEQSIKKLTSQLTSCEKYHVYILSIASHNDFLPYFMNDKNKIGAEMIPDIRKKIQTYSVQFNRELSRLQNDRDHVTFIDYNDLIDNLASDPKYKKYFDQYKPCFTEQAVLDVSTPIPGIYSADNQCVRWDLTHFVAPIYKQIADYVVTKMKK